MDSKQDLKPDTSAARTALWRLLHVELDAPPPVLADMIGAQLLSPEPGWRERPDMDPEGTKPFRAAIVARARFVEDYVLREAERGVSQYVILGAGLDTFAQRHANERIVSVYEIDQPGASAWKRNRLAELGLPWPSWLKFVPVDFEQDQDWRAALRASGFDERRPAVFASLGVSMYLTKAATADLFQKIADLAPGSTLIMTFMRPIENYDPALRIALERASIGAKAAGTPWISLYEPDSILQMVHQAGFRNARHLAAAQWAASYFSGRSDGLAPAEAEELVIASI